MAILVTGNTFATGDNVTAATLNAAVNSATFDTGAVDNATTQLSGGAIIVKDGGITPAKLSTGGPSWTAGGAFTASGLYAGKVTTGAGLIHVADEGANSYNTLTSRNNANNAYLPLLHRSTSHQFAGASGAAWLTVNSTGATTTVPLTVAEDAIFGVVSTGTNISFYEYTTGAQRAWAIRDDSGVDRLRFSRGSTDYAFWDVLKVAASDNISYQIWRCATEYSWEVNGTQRFFLNDNGAGFSGTVFRLPNLPTSSAGLTTGDLWVDTSAGNVVKWVP